MAGYREQIANPDAQDKQITCQLAELVSQSGSTLARLVGLSTVSDCRADGRGRRPQRLTIGGFGRFNGTAPPAALTPRAPASRAATATTGRQHRVNAVLHRMAIT